jgi:hypothetical protein
MTLNNSMSITPMPPLGKEHGRVVLKVTKSHLEERLAKFGDQLKVHQEKVEKELQVKLDESRKQIVEYLVQRVMASPPDAMRGRYLKFGEAEARLWLNDELDQVFPKAKALVQKMQLDVHYKDVTLETLNRKDFLDAIQEAFPRVNWRKRTRSSGRRERKKTRVTASV